MKKKIKMKKKIISFAVATALSLSILSGGALSAFATGTEDNTVYIEADNDNSYYMQSGYDEKYGKTVVPMAQGSSHSHSSGENDIMALGEGGDAKTGCDILDGLGCKNASNDNVESAKSNGKFEVTKNDNGSYSFTWIATLPKTEAFQYRKSDTATLILCDGINSPNIWKNVGNCAASDANLNEYGTWKSFENPHALATVKVAEANWNKAEGSKCGVWGRKYLAYDQGANGTNHNVHTTLRTNVANQRNLFVLKSGIKVTNSAVTHDKQTVSISGTISADTWKAIKAWAKRAQIRTNDKGQYKFTAALVGAASLSAGYTDAGCHWHGVFFKEANGGAGNGISQCRITGLGAPGTKITNMSGIVWDGDVYVQDGLECSVSTWSDSFTFPDEPAKCEYTLVDEYSRDGGASWALFDASNDYSDKEYDVGDTVKVSDWASETAKVDASDARKGWTLSTWTANTTAVKNGGILERKFLPQTFSVSCVDKFFKAGTLVKGPVATPGGAKTYTYESTAKGSDWGTTSPDAYYEYAKETSLSVTGANLTVERHFNMKAGSVIYHSNIPNNDTTLAAVSVYPGDNHTTAAANAFKRDSTYGDGWRLVGWSEATGANNTVNYNCSQSYNLNIGTGTKHLYAVWQPTLKIIRNEGFISYSLNGSSYTDEETILPFTYGTEIKSVSVKMEEKRLFEGAKIDGQPIMDFLEKVQSGAAVTVMNDCHTIILHSQTEAAQPIKKVYKNGTQVDINRCVLNVGDKIDYVITVSNTTSVPRDVDLTDTLDEGLTYISCDNGGKQDGRTLTWQLKQLPANSDDTMVKITAVVNETKKGQTIENIATAVEKKIEVLGETMDGRPEDSNKVENYVMNTPEKHLRKTAETTENIDETIIVPGDSAVYTIQVVNPAPEDGKGARPFTITDKIPAGLTVKSVSDGGIINGQTVTWSGISIAGGAAKTLTVNVSVNDIAQGDTIVNEASVTCDDAMGSKAASNEVENYIMKAPEKSVYLTLNEDGSTNTSRENIDDEVINDGSLVTYKIDWQNPTAKKRTIVLKDTLPEGTRIATAGDLDKASEGIDLSKEYNYANGGAYLITDGGVYDEANKTITWKFESQASDGGVKDNGCVEFTAVVLNAAQDKYVENYAAMTVVSPTGINENNPTMDSNLVRNPVIKTPHKVAMRGTQDVSDLVVNDGDEITYQITFKNPAETPRNFTVTDIVPEFTKLKENTISDGGVYDGDENLITWKMELAAGEEKTVTFTVLALEEGQNQTVKNTARVYVDRAKVKTNDDTPNKIYILEDPKKAVMNIEGEDINGVVKRAGDIITYNIIYKNPADDERVATITDKLPDDVEFVSATNQGSYDVENSQFANTDGQCTYTYDAATNTVVWTTPTAAKCQEMVSVDVRILPSARDKTLRNTASVHIPDATKQTNEVITPVLDNPEKVATDDKGQNLNGNLITIGEEFTYTIEVKNPAEEAKLAYITDTLPKGVEFVSCSEKGFYDVNMHTVSWKKIPLKAKEKYTATIRVRVTEDAKKVTLSNDAVYRIDEATVSTRLEDGGKGGPKTFVATKESLNKKGEDIDKKIVASGSTVLYKITYKNITDKERFFTIVDEIPQEEEIVDIGDNGFICKYPLDGFANKPLTTNTVAWQFYVPAGQEGFVTVTTKVTAVKECKLENHATIRVTSDEDENDVFEKDTNVVVNPVIPYPVKMAFDEKGREITDKMVATGDILTYKIVYKNPADDVRYADIVDILPDEVEFVSCENGGTYDSGSHSVSWKNIESQPHENTTVAFAVKVKESAGGKVVSNKGAVSIDQAIIQTRAKTPASSPEDPEPSDKPTTDNYVSCKRSLDVNGNDISDEVIKVGDTITYRIQYKNTSSVEKQYKIKDTLPEEVDYMDATGSPSVDGKTLTWSLDVKSGEEGYFDITVTINEKGYGRKITNKADITESDPNDPNNPYTITTTSVNNYPLDKDDFVKSVKDKAGKDLDNGITVAGTKLFYHIKLHNPAESKKEFTVTDALPAEVVFTAASDGGVYDEASHTVSWKLELEGGAEADLEIAVKVKNSMTNGTLKNMAHLVTKGTETDTNVVTTLVFGAPVKKQFDGSTEMLDGDTVECNNEVTYKISFENPSDKEMEVTITDSLDANIAERVLSISDGGVLKNGRIVWNVDAAPGVAGEVSFTVSAPEAENVSVSNIAVITYNDDNLTGKNGYKTNEVTFVTKAKGTSDEKDPRKTPEIVKTGDMITNVLGK